MSSWKEYRKTATVEAMFIEQAGDLPDDPRLDPGGDSPRVLVETMEGELRIECPFYLVREVQGELYPVDVDVFEETYELKLGDGAITLHATSDGEDAILAFDDGTCPTPGDFVDVHRVRIPVKAFQEIAADVGEPRTTRRRLEEADWCTSDEVSRRHTQEREEP